jgi:two-component system sensor histidine kinase KdpD
MPTIRPVKRARLDARRFALASAAIVGALALGSVAVVMLEGPFGVPDASAIYLLAVVGVAVLVGTTPAILTAVGSFLLYDYLFTEPRYTFTVRDSGEYLNLLLLLVIGAIVGRLAGEERDRAERALAREREARALFKISFSLSSLRETSEALESIVATLLEVTRMTRIWVVFGEAVAADSSPASAPPPPGGPTLHASLRRRPGDEPAEWVRVHAPGRGPAGARGRDPAETAYRVAIAVGDRTFGDLWGTRPRSLGDPDPGETRVLAAAADQLGGSLERRRLLRDAMSAEVSRRSDALKSALLDSVSHDLRTPLASIRAAAGTLMDPEVAWPEDEQRSIAASIDREAEWLNRLVTNLLDMSRIEAGELKPSLGLFELQDLVGRAVGRAIPAGTASRLTIDLPADLPPVLVDEVFIGQVLANTLDNAVKYAGDTAPIAVSARSTDDGTSVRVTIEDGGPGVPPEALSRLFEKFYRVPRKAEGSRRGTGIGLSVVQGLVAAMGGRVTVRKSDLGGLAVDVDLPAAPAMAAG